jgi:hypothetical protein
MKKRKASLYPSIGRPALPVSPCPIPFPGEAELLSCLSFPPEGRSLPCSTIVGRRLAHAPDGLSLAKERIAFK